MVAVWWQTATFAPTNRKRFDCFSQEFGLHPAYLFMGAFDGGMKGIYELFQLFDYILVWRSHGLDMRGNKKGNVDTDVVFQMMRDMYERKDADGFVLVSGDGDYWRTVEHLRKNGKLKKVLLPSHENASSLYKGLTDEYRVYLDTSAARKKFGRKE